MTIDAAISDARLAAEAERLERLAMQPAAAAAEAARIRDELERRETERQQEQEATEYREAGPYDAVGAPIKLETREPSKVLDEFLQLASEAPNIVTGEPFARAMVPRIALTRRGERLNRDGQPVGPIVWASLDPELLEERRNRERLAHEGFITQAAPLTGHHREITARTGVKELANTGRHRGAVGLVVDDLAGSWADTAAFGELAPFYHQPGTRWNRDRNGYNDHPPRFVLSSIPSPDTANWRTWTCEPVNNDYMPESVAGQSWWTIDTTNPETGHLHRFVLVQNGSGLDLRKRQ